MSEKEEKDELFREVHILKGLKDATISFSDFKEKIKKEKEEIKERQKLNPQKLHLTSI